MEIEVCTFLFSLSNVENREQERNNEKETPEILMVMSAIKTKGWESKQGKTDGNPLNCRETKGGKLSIDLVPCDMAMINFMKYISYLVLLLDTGCVFYQEVGLFSTSIRLSG